MYVLRVTKIRNKTESQDIKSAYYNRKEALVITVLSVNLMTNEKLQTTSYITRPLNESIQFQKTYAQFINSKISKAISDRLRDTMYTKSQLILLKGFNLL